MNCWDSLPEKFLERTKEIIPQDKQEEVFSSFCHRHPSTFRANTLKISADELQTKLKDLGIETDKVPWYTDAFILKNVPQRILTEIELYKQGFFYVQSLSSMIPPLVLNPQPKGTVLDIAAAPGSKTTQIAALMNNTGEILANDKSHVRNFKLKANLNLQGVTNAQVTQLPGEIIWKKIPEFFDKALVDVPCSMEGRFYTEDPKSYRDWSTTKIQQLQNTQKFLLRSAIGATKVGGIIVYSTCTLSVEENEEVIDWILQKEKGKIDIEPISLPGLPLSNPILQWKHKIFNPNIEKCVRVLPSPLMEGFFIAKIRKIAPTVAKGE